MDERKQNVLQNLPEGCPVKIADSGKGFSSSAIGTKVLIGAKGTYARNDTVGYRLIGNVADIPGECNAKTNEYNGFHGWDSFDIDEDELKKWNVRIKGEVYIGGEITSLNHDYTVTVKFPGVNSSLTRELKNIEFESRKKFPREGPAASSKKRLNDWDFVQISDSEFVYKVPNNARSVKITKKDTLLGPEGLPYHHLVFDLTDPDDLYEMSSIKSLPDYAGIVEITQGHLFYGENLRCLDSVSRISVIMRRYFPNDLLSLIENRVVFAQYEESLIVAGGIDDDRTFFINSFALDTLSVVRSYMFMEAFSFDKKFVWISEETGINLLKDIYTLERFPDFSGSLQAKIKDWFQSILSPVSEIVDKSPLVLGQFYWSNVRGSYFLPLKFDSSDGTVLCYVINPNKERIEDEWIGGASMSNKWKQWDHLELVDLSTILDSINASEHKHELLCSLADFDYNLYISHFSVLKTYAQDYVADLNAPIEDDEDEEEEEDEEEDLERIPEESPILLGEYYWDSQGSRYILPYEFDEEDGTTKCLFIDHECEESDSRWIGGNIGDWKNWEHLEQSDFTSFIHSIESWSTAESLFTDLSEYNYSNYVSAYQELIDYSTKALQDYGAEDFSTSESSDDDDSDSCPETPVLDSNALYRSNEIPFFISAGNFDPDDGMQYGIGFRENDITTFWAGGTIEDWEEYAYKKADFSSLQDFVVQNYTLSSREELITLISERIDSDEFDPNAIRFVDLIFTPDVRSRLEMKLEAVKKSSDAPVVEKSSLSDVEVDDFFLLKRR